MSENIATPETGGASAAQPATIEDRIISLIGADDKPPSNDSSHPEATTTHEAEPASEVEPVTEETLEAEGDDPEGGAVSEPEELNLSTLEELAEATGLDVDTILGLKTKAKIDEQESEVTLAELRKSYQLEGHLTKAQMKLAETRKAFEAEREARTKQLEEQLNLSAAMVDKLNKEFTSQYEAIPWDELRQEDPARYAALKQDFNDRLRDLEGLNGQVRTEYEKYQQGLLRDQQAKHQEFVKSEYQRAAEVFPELKDEVKSREFFNEIKSYMTGGPYGYTEDELNSGIVDHRQLILISKAMKYDQGQKKSDVVKKKLVTLPKVVKPGVQKSKGDVQSDKLKQMRQRLKKSGKLHDAVSIVEAYL